MGLITFLQKRRYKKKVSFWPYSDSVPLNISFPFSVNGLTFGCQIDDARQFGKPDVIDCLFKTTVRFEFRKSGIELEFEDEKLDYAGFVFMPEENIPEWPDGTPASVILSGLDPALTSLSADTDFEEVKRILGTPDDEDIDEYEKILTYEKGDDLLEFEFTPENRLVRFNVFSYDED